MRTSIDRAGRLVIPRSLREEARIAGGGEVEIRVHDGVIEIEPVPMEVRIVRRGPIHVAVPKGRLAGVLRGAEVERTRRNVRRSRMR